MQFASRTPRTAFQKLYQLIWPSMGWRRVAKYYWLRVLRLRDTPSQIARGVVAGVVVCFTPLPITHIVQAAVVAWVVRGNILAALIASWAGNPWTYPLMWAAAYHTGHAVYGVMGWTMMQVPTTLSWGEFWDLLVNHPYDVMVPWVVGGYVVAILVSPILYYTIRPLIARAQDARAQIRRRARIARRRAMGWRARLAARGASA